MADGWNTGCVHAGHGSWCADCHARERAARVEADGLLVDAEHAAAAAAAVEKASAAGA